MRKSILALLALILVFASSASPSLAAKNVSLNLLRGATPTYSAATALFTPGAAATDIATITGSATKVIKILHVEFSMTQTASGITPVLLIKRSTADTGGTPVAATVVPLDINNPAGTATVNAYTANPGALGTSVGNVLVANVNVPVAASVVSPSQFVLFDAHLAGQPIVLRGTGDVLAVNLAGVTPAGAATAAVTIYFTEEGLAE